MINSTVALGMAFHDVLESPSSDSLPANIAPLYPLLKGMVKLLAIARDDIQAKFPLPSTAPGHAERAKHVFEVLERLQRLVVRLAKDHEIKPEVVERHLTRVKPFLHDMGVLIGENDL